MKAAPSRARALLLAAAVALAAPAAATAADDPLFAEQWALDSATIGAAEAWTQSNGAGVLVAVLDTGLQLNHPDLAANVWTNPGEVAGNRRDDDANGIVDDVHGANMFDSSNRIGDDNGHGTHVAGIVAALQGGGHLDVGAAMRHVAGGQRPRTAAAAQAVVPKLRLRAKSKVHAGARATLRWKASGATRVRRWRVSLNGHVIARLRPTARRVTRRIARTGRHTWRVVGLDAEGERVVIARRTFGAVAARSR